MADDMFRAPIHHGMRALDRSQFAKTVPLTAARVFDNKNISAVRAELERSKDALQQDRLGSVHADPDPERAQAGTKCILLRPEAATGDSPASPHSPTVSSLVTRELISVIPFTLRLDYAYWTYHDIITALLPPSTHAEIPSGFSQVGHIAHLNLRAAYLAHKHLVAAVLLDKNPSVRTVINKTDDVGEANAFRTFKYEVLAGPDDLNVELSEENCLFRFDYSKVYWNSRLNTEHRRLVASFRAGEAVCDVMAGIGPFAVPAGKKHVFVWANDLNPDSYASLEDAVRRNKVAAYVKPFNQDGRSFIRTATAQLAQAEPHGVEILPAKAAKKEHRAAAATASSEPPASVTAPVLRTLLLPQPKVFAHYILNLPASALTFLPAFVGMYPPPLLPHLPPNNPAAFPMPLVHVYCFSTKSDDNVAEGAEICAEIGRMLGFEMWPGRVGEGEGEGGEGEGAVEVWDVRDVAPRKRMFCATFRVPREVAFRGVG
ncbi:hypothetical protein LTR08_004215 [Meristemomyces frigidus]|nr:hypothetical protein LTR08_004215 [Meristemomyces frigidus]